MRIYSTNILVRVIREDRRRINVVGVFPDERSLIRLAGILPVDIWDECDMERHYYPGPERTCPPSMGGPRGTGSQDLMLRLTHPEQMLIAEAVPLRLAPYR